jgi:hypothetical protein
VFGQCSNERSGQKNPFGEAGALLSFQQIRILRATLGLVLRVSNYRSPINASGET